MGVLTIRGTVKTVLTDRNYGFIKGINGIEYFFHRDDFEGHWNDLVTDHGGAESIPVTFEDNPSLKGPRARNVKREDFPN
jgi:cold shock CspA family protein